MNTQRVQDCTQATVICLINAYIDTLVEMARAPLAKAQEGRERKLAYQEFRKLNKERLRDIGMDDPQQQLKILGRYL